MKSRPRPAALASLAKPLAVVLAGVLVVAPISAQTGPPVTVNQTQQLVFAGLRSASAKGQFNSVKADASGNLYLLLDQGDGIRLLKADPNATTILGQTLLGAAGDIGAALALGPTGNVYVTGTTTSTALTATPGAAIPARTDASTNSFLAAFDSNLTPLFVTFTGGSRIAASALAVTADAVFVTGSIFSATLPITPGAFTQSPASGSTQNGFVEKFSVDGSTLLYSTYITGISGNTAPAAIAADASDHAYIVGSTASSAFPTIAALVPNILSTPSGFLTRLTPSGDGADFSTYISGPGLTSVSLDTTAQSLLVSGSIALGQFPIQTVSAPIAPLEYQSLLKLPLDGSTVQSSILLAPGAQSFLAPTPDGSVWLDQPLSAPLLPSPTFASLGDTLALRINPHSAIDESGRFGGLPNANPTFASLPTALTSIATDPTGAAIVAGSVQPTASSSLLATETYDLPLVNALTAALPSTLRSAEVSAATCSGSLCAGSTAYLAKLDPTAAAPSLTISADDAPYIILRNLGSAPADALTLTATLAPLSTNCPTTLPSAAECAILLTNPAPSAATLTVSANNASPQTIPISAFTPAASTIVVSPEELDFGIQTSTSSAALRTLTVSNLGPTTQTFASAILVSPLANTSSFSESSSDCPLAADLTLKILPSGATCHITLAFTALPTPSADGFLGQYWQVGPHSILLTAYSQAAALAVSSPEIDFGTQFPGGRRLPRFLYLSNASNSPISHAAVTLPASSPFTLADTCPSLIPPQSVCALRLDYLSPVTPSEDSVTLTLDPDGLGQNLTVLVTGQTLPTPNSIPPAANPNLTITPVSITFTDPVAVTTVSTSIQTVTITNTGASPVPLALNLIGDFTQQSVCPASLSPSQTCTVTLTFTPSQPGVREGLLTIATGPTFAPTSIPLTGTASAILPANNGILDLGATVIGQPIENFSSIAHSFPSLTAATTGPYTIALIPNLGFGPGQPPASAFSASASAACLDCFLALRFAPTAPTTHLGTLTISSDPAGKPYTLALTGTGLPATGLLLTPSNETFGTVAVSSSSPPYLFILTNLLASQQPITLNAPAVTGDFAVNPSPTGGQPCSGILSYTASCLLQLSFVPTATGPRTGSLTFTASDGTTVSATLSGSATPDTGLAFNPNALIFHNVPGTIATQQSITLTNTGISTLQIGPPTLTTPSFSASSTCLTLAPAATCGITVTFTPASALTSDTLTIPATSTLGASSDYLIPLTGAYTAISTGLQITPAQTAFGPADIAINSPARQYTVQNLTTSTLSLNLSFPRQFALVGPPCTTLAPSASCIVTAQFIPLTNADTTGSLLAHATSAGITAPIQTIAYLDGYGLSQTGPISLFGPIQSGILNFGQVTSGQTGSITLTLTNQNPSPITVRRVTAAPPFLSTTTCGLTLAPSQTCTITLNYAPTNQVPTGTPSPPNTTDTGLLTIESDASSSPDLINLTGQGGPVTSSSPSDSLPRATYTLSQGSLTFPATAAGNASPPQTVTLQNTGSIPLHLSSAFTTPDFSAQSTCANVPPSAFCTLTVTSTPQSSGNHIAAIQLALNSTASLDFISLFSPATSSSPAQSLTVMPTTLDFGAVLVTSSSTLPVQVTNTGSTPILFTSLTTNGDYAPSGTCPAPGTSLLASQSCIIQVTFTPTQTGPRTGVLSIVTNASPSPITITLAGTGIQSRLTVTPSALNFGSVALGTSARLPVTLTNGGTAPVTNLALTLTGDYALTQPCPSSSLAPAASCTAQVTFNPQATGPRPGTLTIASSDPHSPSIVSLTGMGIQSELTVAPSTLSFGDIALGAASPLTLTLTNNGTAPVTNLAVTLTGDYALTQPCPISSFAPAASCTLQITFTPQAIGPRHGTLTITSTDHNSPIVVSLNGVGTSPGSGNQAGSFTLTVSGASSATVTVTAPASAIYSLAVNPTGGYTGSVALTCAPIAPGVYATCSIQPATVTLANSPQSSLATITTSGDPSLTQTRPNAHAYGLILATVLLIIPKTRRRFRPYLVTLFLTLLVATTSCGSGISKSIHYTPAGSYQYQVTAASTTGPEITQTVTLNLVVKSPF